MRIFIMLLFLSLFAPLQSAAQAPAGGANDVIGRIVAQKI